MDDAQIRTLRSHEEMVVRVLDAVSNCSIHDRGRVLRRLSMQYHPDKPTGSTVLFQMFSSLTSLSIPDLYYKKWEFNSKIYNLIMAPTRAAFENRQSLVDGAFVYGMPGMPGMPGSDMENKSQYPADWTLHGQEAEDFVWDLWTLANQSTTSRGGHVCHEKKNSGTSCFLDEKVISRNSSI